MVSFQTLLDSGDFSLDFQEPGTGRTALYTALDCEYPREDYAMELIKRGANVELCDAEEITPLMIACARGCKETAKELVMRVSDIEVQDEFGLTAMAFAVRYSSVDMVKVMLRGGASVRTKDNFGLSLFHQAISCGNLPTSEYLLREFYFFSVHDRDSHGRQALHLVAKSGNTQSAEWLIDQGAEVDVRSYFDMTPLMDASFHGKIDVACVLVQAGANVNLPADFTSLRFASNNGHLLMARQLLLWGADPLGMGTGQETARQVALLRGHDGIVQLLDS
jgi:ankyrin repeat protein